MPKIFLKPGSPEFAEKENEAKSETCEMPGCSEKGEHKAPKNRGLNEYFYFCFEHVREYNKAWNFFTGMSDKEVENHMVSSMYGDRPTWRYDNGAAAEDILKRKAWQTYHFTDEEPQNDFKARHQNQGRRVLDQKAPEREAMAIMGLEPPVTLDALKKRYKHLAKKHHPDLNKGCTKSEDLLKEINMAYTILKVAFEEYEKLPER